jgi:riboflavin synthase
MFTGIVERSARVLGIEDAGPLRRLDIEHAWTDLRPGESVAVNGACLTVVSFDAGRVSFDVVAETLARTNLGRLAPGDLVHVERSLRVGDRLDGHFVQGHVDGTALLLEHRVRGDDWRTAIALPPALAPYVVPKGSITLDGVSLTVASLYADRFEVALIPTTLQVTQLGRREPGWPINVEADMMAKTVVRFLQLRSGVSPRAAD